MKMALLKFSKEIKALIYTIIILSIVYGFNDFNKNFIFSDWSGNFISNLILVIIVVLTFFIGIKTTSKIFNYETEFAIWKLKYYWFQKRSYFPIRPIKLKLLEEIKGIHLGTFIALFIMLISNGILYFTAIFTFNVKNKKKLGKDKVFLKDFKGALITFFSLCFIIILIILFKILNIERGITIGAWFIIWNLLPIGPLLGSKIFFGSRTFYFGFLVFIAFFLSLVAFIPLYLTLMIATLFSVIALIAYFAKFEYK